MNRRLVVALAVVAVALTPDLAHACAVCFSANAKNREAFLATTAFLSLLPLGLAGGLWMWIRRRAAALQRQADAAAAPAGAPVRTTPGARAFRAVPDAAPAGSR
jgi:hypothetical protein